MSDCAEKMKAVADAVLNLAERADGLAKRYDRLRSDASREVHETEASFAKKMAQKGLEAGDHDVAKKWVEYGTKHAEAAAEKAERIEGPPEDQAKKDKKK
jgi:hypothetical protein